MPTMITAHSGCEGTAENSSDHIRCAIDCDVDALEVDVRIRADGELYLSHDESLQAGQCLTLREAFSLIAGSGLYINCDLKSPGIEGQVLALARSCGTAEQLVFSGTVSPAALTDPEIQCRTFWNIEEAVPSVREWCRKEQNLTPSQLREVLEQCRRFSVPVLNVYYELCTPAFLLACRQAGVGVSAWTVNDEIWARTLLDAHICNLTTRSPRMVRTLREHGVP